MGVCVALVNKLDPPGPARERKKAPWKGALTLFEWTHSHYFIVQQQFNGKKDNLFCPKEEELCDSLLQCSCCVRPLDGVCMHFPVFQIIPKSFLLLNVVPLVHNRLHCSLCADTQKTCLILPSTILTQPLGCALTYPLHNCPF